MRPPVVPKCCLQKSVPSSDHHQLQVLIDFSQMSFKLAPLSQGLSEAILAPSTAATTAPITTTTTTKSSFQRQHSRVWPLQLANLGTHSGAIWRLPEAPWARELECEFQTETYTRRRPIYDRLKLAGKQAKLSCRVLSQDFSEICFVGGYITALVGSLVAISGIFTRNQARTRLYMEGFGCGMVILGVLVVFFSLRMRAYKDCEMTQLRQLFQNSRNNNSNNFVHPAQRNPAGLVVSNGLAVARAMPDLAPACVTPSLLLDHRPMLVGGDENNEHEKRQTGDGANGPFASLVTPTLSQCANMTNSATMVSAAESDAAEVASDAVDLSIDEDEELSLAGCPKLTEWTPCDNESDWTYPNDLHEAATIEAALSIVLTVATLAGFRPGGAEIRLRPDADDRHEHFCCLHHTVQHKLQARKWINCLKAHNNHVAQTAKKKSR